VLGAVALVTGMLADIRLVFSLLPLFLILAIAMGTLLPNRWPYRRLHDVPGVGDMLMAFAAAFVVLTGVLFFNQTRSGLGVLLLLVILTVRFFTGFTLDDIGAEKDREGPFANQGPPVNLPERIGSPRTRKLLLGTNIVAVILFGLLILFDVVGVLAVYPLIGYLFSFVFVYVVSRQNAARMARYYAVTDGYIFFLLTALGWAAFRYSGA